MRILYVASNSELSETLLLEKEITELQRRLSKGTSFPKIEIKFLPALQIEELATEISIFSPTVLHISAHGHGNSISFVNSNGDPIPVTGNTLAALINVPKPPTLVYLNACCSLPVAQHVAQFVPAAIGTTSDISNHAARVSAVRFYEALLEGSTIGKAFDNAQALLQAISEGKTNAKLCFSIDETRDIRLVDSYQIVARFGSAEKPKFRPNKHGEFKIQCGVIGCPQDATVVSFFTDDESFETDDKDDLCRGIAKGPPVREKLWLELTEVVYGDFRIGAAGITGGGHVFAAYSMLSDALELHFARGGYNTSKKGSSSSLSQSDITRFHQAVATLRKFDAG